jgi:hypothetical protein
MIPSSPLTSNPNPSNSEQYETDHVHKIYDEIASHFSSTRYKVSYVVLVNFGVFFFFQKFTLHSSIFGFFFF